MRSAFILVVLALTTSAPALPRSNYAGCTEAPDPPACIARQALSDGWLTRDEAADAIIRHGFVDLVPRKSGLLVRAARERLTEGTKLMKIFGDPASKESPQQLARASKSEVILAAIALLTAARHQEDPFADATVQLLMRKARNDPMIPFLALDVWHELIQYGGTSFKSVTFAGFRSIWSRVSARREQAPEYVDDIVDWLEFYGVLRDETKVFRLWFANRTGATAIQKAVTARRLVNEYSAADAAEQLLGSLGAPIPDHDVSDIRASIVIVRLKSGYDESAARLLVSYQFDDLMRTKVGSRTTVAAIPGALEKCGAVRELRELADENLRRAQAFRSSAESMKWYAEASDLYRRAGDREKAREVARLGLPFVADEVRKHVSESLAFPGTSPRWLAANARGQGTRPVVALYSAGAIDEALKFGYLTGYDRYVNAPTAGEMPDPQWVIDDDSRSSNWAMAVSAIDSGDPVLQRRALEAFKKSCKAGYADCYDEWLTYLAALAAVMGDEAEMKQNFIAQTKHLDSVRNPSSSALELAAQYAHALELLAASHIPASH